jgi:hypothetical protein
VVDSTAGQVAQVQPKESRVLAARPRSSGTAWAALGL